ncbi:hypothetical protein MRX96_042402 [Rhipicephalus microplus]
MRNARRRRCKVYHPPRPTPTWRNRPAIRLAGFVFVSRWPARRATGEGGEEEAMQATGDAFVKSGRARSSSCAPCFVFFFLFCVVITRSLIMYAP